MNTNELTTPTETENITTQIATIDSQITELDSQLADRQTDLTTVQDQLNQLDLQAQTIQRQIDMSLDDLQVAVVKANAAINTPNEVKAAAAAADQKKVVDQARKALEKLAKQSDKNTPALKAKASELETSIKTLTDQIAALREQRMTLVLAREQVADEQAQAKYHQHLEGLEQKRDEIESLRSQLSDALINLHTLKNAGMDDLADNPELQKQIRSFVEKDDSVTRILDSAIHYIQAILDDGRIVKSLDLKLASLQRPMFGPLSFFDAAIVPASEVTNALSNATGATQPLEDRLHWLKRIVDEYQQL